MFTIDDLWRIMKYLKDGTTDSNLSGLTTTLATSEKELSITFFEQVIDQQTFDSDDYRRLREMFIDWYSSHKTIATTQRHATDVHQLPNTHLSELFKSFGFPHGLNLVPLTAKANFFLDLVNFYKKKGTPETLVDVLDYYGFSDTDLIEYWLQKDQYDNLIFRGESVRLAATGSTVLLDSDVPFNKLIADDPHWLQPEDKIESLIQTNVISLPSKSPYYSLSSIFSLYSITISLSILFRIVEDQYERFLLDLELPYNTPVKNLGLILPILHVYVGAIYCFEKMFGNGVLTTFSQYNCYNGDIVYEGNPPLPINLSELTSIYEELIKTPLSRDDRTNKLNTLLDEWSRPLSQSFVNSINASEALLTTMNPNFKDIIDSWFVIGDEGYLITYLIGTLDNWIRLNIDSKSPSLVITMLGLGFREELEAIINFFKPYRARLAFMDTAFSIKNPLAESIILDEWLLTEIQQNNHDHIRPPGGYCLEMSNQAKADALIDLEQLMSSTWSWDTGRHFDSPPIIPTLPPEPSLFPPTLCNNIEWLYDMGRKYDIPIPPEYLNFSYDSGGYYDILPILQKCLMELIKNHPDGGMCDSIDYQIGLTFRDYICPIEYWDSNWDTGASFDSPKITQWKDSFGYDNNERPGDNIPLTDDPNNYQIQQNVRDTFGEDYPTQMDVGQSFDTMTTKSVVRDSFQIEISETAKSTSTTEIGGYPVPFDSGRTFDSLVNLDIVFGDRIIEWMSSSISVTTDINSIGLSSGDPESLEAFANISSYVNSDGLTFGVERDFSSSITIDSIIDGNIAYGYIETITSTSSIETEVLTTDLDIGIIELLSTSINAINTIEANLIRGIVVLLSTSTSNISQTTSILNLGESEIISGNCNISTNIISSMDIVSTVYTTRSIIIDVANNYGDLTNLALMAIKFSKNGSIINVGTPGSNYTAYATTTKSAGGYAAWKLFYHTIPLTGTVENWMSSDNQITDQRIIFNYGNGFDFDEISFYNYHASGTDTDKGIEFLKVYTSTDIQSDTTYGNTISNSTLIFNGTIDEHTTINEEDKQSITIGVYEATASITTNISDPDLMYDVVSANCHTFSNTNDSNLTIGIGEELAHTCKIPAVTRYRNTPDLIFTWTLWKEFAIISNVGAELSIGGTSEILRGTSESNNNVNAGLDLNVSIEGSSINTTNCSSDIISGSIETITSTCNIVNDCEAYIVIGDFTAITNIYSSVGSNLDLDLTGTIGITTEFDSLLDVGVEGLIQIESEVIGVISSGIVELLSSSTFSISIVDSNLEFGIDELLYGTSIVQSLGVGVLVIGDNEELIGSSNVITSILSNLDTGDNEELIGSSYITSNIIGSLYIEILIVGSSNVVTYILSNLDIGENETLSSISSSFTNVDSILVTGDNEGLTGTSNSTTEFSSNLLVGEIEELSGTSNSTTELSSFIVFEEIEVLSAVININTNIDLNFDLEVGDNEGLTGTSNSVTDIIGSYIVVPESEILSAVININTNIDLNFDLEVGDNEGLTGTSNSITFIYTSTIVTGVTEILTTTSESVSDIDGDLTIT